MPDIARIDADDARRRVEEHNALLVCAYDNDDRCRALRLGGALTMSEFRAMTKALPPGQEIIFYCA